MVSENILKAFPIISYGSYMLPWKPELQSNQPNNHMQSFPLPDDALHEI